MARMDGKLVGTVNIPNLGYRIQTCMVVKLRRAQSWALSPFDSSIINFY